MSGKSADSLLETDPDPLDPFLCPDTPFGVSFHFNFSLSISSEDGGSGKSIFSGLGFCLIHSRTKVTLELESCKQDGMDMILSIKSVITGMLSRR